MSPFMEQFLNKSGQGKHFYHHHNILEARKFIKIALFLKRRAAIAQHNTKVALYRRRKSNLHYTRGTLKGAASGGAISAT